MKKTFKGLFALLLSSVLVLSACTGGGTSSSESTPDIPVDSSSTTVSETPSSNAPAPTGDVTEITIWTKDRHDNEYMTALFDKFMVENPDIKVNYEMYTDNYRQTIDIAANNGELPDIVCTFTPVTQALMDRDALIPLNDHMTDEQKELFPENLFVEGINVKDDNIYSFPFTGNTLRLVYNKDLFAKVGIDKAPETLDDMVAAAIKITEELGSEGVYGWALPLKAPDTGFNRGPVQIPSVSGEPVVGGFDFSKGEFDWSSYKPVFEAIRKIYDANAAFPGTESLDIDPLRTQFADGKIGMYFTYSHSEYGVYKDQFPTEYEWAYAPLPVISERNGTHNLSAGTWYSITKNTKNEDAAWRVLEYMYSYDNALAYYEQGLGVSVLPKVIENATTPEAIAYTEYMGVTPMDAMWPPIPQNLSIEGKTFGDAFADYIFGDTDDIDAIITDLNTRYNAAYRDSIDKGVNKEAVYPNIKASDPAGTAN